jgi:hypothetical protein
MKAKSAFKTLDTFITGMPLYNFSNRDSIYFINFTN